MPVKPNTTLTLSVTTANLSEFNILTRYYWIANVDDSIRTSKNHYLLKLHKTGYSQLTLADKY